jgi:hypothetical protein
MLKKLHLSYKDPVIFDMKSCEFVFLEFFGLLKEIPSVEIVRIEIGELKLSTFTKILIEQYDR